MELVPFISLKDGKIHTGTTMDLITIDNVFNRVNKDTMLYVLDFDGITNNNSNVDLYQKLADHCILWIDSGPRRIDDVMDTIMAGATSITVRTDLWPDVNIPDIVEITDNDIYLALTPDHLEQPRTILRSYENLGAVVFSEDKHFEHVLTSAYMLSEPMLKHKIYLYSGSPQNASYWSQRGVTGLLVDLQIKEGDK